MTKLTVAFRNFANAPKTGYWNITCPSKRGDFDWGPSS